MTNEEKAVGIGLHVRDLCLSQGVTRDNAETASLLAQQSAMEMAKWKDQRMIEALNKAIESANAYYDKKPNQNMLCRNIGKIEVLSMLLDKPFPYDKLHMNFTTMD